MVVMFATTHPIEPKDRMSVSEHGNSSLSMLRYGHFAVVKDVCWGRLFVITQHHVIPILESGFGLMVSEDYGVATHHGTVQGAAVMNIFAADRFIFDGHELKKVQ
jgi:hypothetical protein